MAKSFQVTVVSADQHLFSGEVVALAATTQPGEVGILAGHTPYMALLQAGQVRLSLDQGEEEIIYVSGGLLEVQPQQTIVLADDAARAEALNEENIRRMQQQAQEKLAQDKMSGSDYSQAEAMLLQSMAQLAALERSKKRH